MRRQYNFSPPGQQQRKQQPQQQPQQQQQPQAQGQDEDPFALQSLQFSYLEPGLGLYPTTSPGLARGYGLGHQQQQSMFAGQAGQSNNGLPPGLRQLADFNQDADGIGSPAPQPKLGSKSLVSPPAQHSYSYNPASSGQDYIGVPNPQSNPQSDQRAGPWNPVTLRTPPQASQAIFGNVGQPSTINPDLLSPHGYAQPSSTATSQPGYTSPSTVTHTYSDGVSVISEWSCPDCTQRLGDPRSLRRHQKERHAMEGRYFCACGKQTTRNHNHLRHMKSCVPKRHDSMGIFTCRCGEQDGEYHRHVAHIRLCGKEKAGRRPRYSEARHHSDVSSVYTGTM